MKSKMYKAKSALYEKVLITDDQIYLAISTYKTKEEIEKQMAKGSKLSGIKNIPFNKIKKVEYNNGDSKLSVHYENKDFKLKKQNITFEKGAESNVIGDFLGAQLGLKKEVRDEKRLLKLLGNLIAFLVVLGGLIYLFNETNFLSFVETETSRSRSGRKAGGILAILSMIGHKGTLGIGALLAAITGYTAYSEFKKPSQLVSYV